MNLPATSDRVRRNTPEHINRRIEKMNQCLIEYYQNHPELIDKRLQELNQEWDIERALEANASSLVLGGSLMGLMASRKFFAVPLVVGSFLLLHAYQGWCPPLRLLRRLGYRTAAEIETERHALLSHRPTAH